MGGAGLTILFLSQNVDVFIGDASSGIRVTSASTPPRGSWRLLSPASLLWSPVAWFSPLSRLQDDYGLLKLKLLKSIRQMGL
jgi:hypothetical protein